MRKKYNTQELERRIEKEKQKAQEILKTLE